jgi:hypothetical protein
MHGTTPTRSQVERFAAVQRQQHEAPQTRPTPSLMIQPAPINRRRRIGMATGRKSGG